MKITSIRKGTELTMKQTEGCTYLMKAQVVGDRGRCVKYHAFRTHDQSKAIEGLQETKLELAPRYVHVVKVEKVESFGFSFQPLLPFCGLY